MTDATMQQAIRTFCQFTQGFAFVTAAVMMFFIVWGWMQ